MIRRPRLGGLLELAKWIGLLSLIAAIISATIGTERADAFTSSPDDCQAIPNHYQLPLANLPEEIQTEIAGGDDAIAYMSSDALLPLSGVANDYPASYPWNIRVYAGSDIQYKWHTDASESAITIVGEGTKYWDIEALEEYQQEEGNDDTWTARLRTLPLTDDAGQEIATWELPFRDWNGASPNCVLFSHGITAETEYVAHGGSSTMPDFLSSWSPDGGEPEPEPEPTTGDITKVQAISAALAIAIAWKLVEAMRWRAPGGK